MKKFKWALVIFWMIVVFVFSSQKADISNGKSEFVIYIFQLLGLNLNKLLGNMANFTVRKVSHFLEYFILGVLLFNAAKEKLKLKKLAVFLISMVFLYSCSDEIHQLFVSGRTARMRDVIIDTAGGITGFLICYFWYKKKAKEL
ncbi:VanZ family protein [Clostridium luticellarii]|jgi:VanZ family protein|uniref:VanZ like family protein n=1 Tax=Clostridium luticellarii TaxID=1691940 RepID=A0A2T0B6K9_9CLOT|nr:VanZ family protein [Clostridium luticellarii]MCI1969601.1 VanZ family protein [Clostridium luticellarii]MCI1996819.1 VanZ family protein [Clostridium luticellarii]MCI2041079.1 VanZ family protein [Clostridium luticellarii]PRR79538.1 VanZ like family protein [Clostridium luticellarii]